jgi:hypothetical protein
MSENNNPFKKISEEKKEEEKIDKLNNNKEKNFSEPINLEKKYSIPETDTQKTKKSIL